MADWSALTSGFAGGVQVGQKYRKNKQLGELRKQKVETGEYELRKKRREMKVDNPDAIKGGAKLGYARRQNPDWRDQMGDPFGERLWNWGKSKLGFGGTQALPDEEVGEEAALQPQMVGGAGTTTFDQPLTTEAFTGAETAALPEEAAPAVPEDSWMRRPWEEEQAMLRDGGPIHGYEGVRPEDIERYKRREETMRSRQPSPEAEEYRAQRATQSDFQKGEPKKYEPAQDPHPKKGGERTGKTIPVEKRVSGNPEVGRWSRLPTSMSAARRGLNLAGRGGLPLALTATAIDTGLTDTEEMRKQLGRELAPGEENTFLGDVGVRSEYAGRRLADVATMGLVPGRFGLAEKRGATPTQQAVPTEEGPMLATSEEGGPLETVTSTARALPAEPQRVDFSDVDAEPGDVPNMQMDDWVKYRGEMIQAAQATGNVKDVVEANDAVTKMQMSGFLHYGQQGHALLAAGDPRRASMALRAAFQYFPNGNDVEFKMHTDPQTGQKQLVGFGKDEKTGKRIEGTEMVMDPDRLAALLENFSNPSAWRQWTKDERQFAQDLRKYEEVDKPTAQSMADYRAGAVEADMARAAGAGRGGLTPAELRGSGQEISALLLDMGITDPQQRLDLRSRVVRLMQATGADEATALKSVLEYPNAGRGAAAGGGAGEAAGGGAAVAAPGAPRFQRAAFTQAVPTGEDDYVSRTMQVESGGRATATNPESTATGVGQFTEGTWLEQFQKKYPQEAATLSEEEILALRNDPRRSAALIEQYGAQNAEALRRAGFPDTPANKYLLHFLGPAGGLNLLSASPNTPVDRVIGADSIEANQNVLQGKTVGQVIAWAQQKYPQQQRMTGT